MKVNIVNTYELFIEEDRFKHVAEILLDNERYTFSSRISEDYDHIRYEFTNEIANKFKVQEGIDFRVWRIHQHPFKYGVEFVDESLFTAFLLAYR